MRSGVNYVRLRRCEVKDQMPLRVIRFGSVWASIWGLHSQKGPWSYHVTFRCRYKEYGVWQDASTFGPCELRLLAQAAELALAWIYAQPRNRPAND